MPYKDPAVAKQKMRAYYLKHREERIAYAQAWNNANVERHKANAKEYYAKNKEAIKARVLAWQKANPKKLSEYRKKSLQRKDSGKERARKKAYYHANKAKIMARKKLYHLRPEVKAREAAYQKKYRMLRKANAEHDEAMRHPFPITLY